MAFMNGKFTDVVFQGFYTTTQPKTESEFSEDKSTAEKPTSQSNNPSGASSDEEMKEDIDLEASSGVDGVNSQMKSSKL